MLPYTECTDFDKSTEITYFFLLSCYNFLFSGIQSHRALASKLFEISRQYDMIGNTMPIIFTARRFSISHNEHWTHTSGESRRCSRLSMTGGNARAANIYTPASYSHKFIFSVKLISFSIICPLTEESVLFSSTKCVRWTFLMFPGKTYKSVVDVFCLRFFFLF